MLNRIILSHHRQSDFAGRETCQGGAAQRRGCGYHWLGLLAVLMLFPAVARAQSATPTPCLMDGNLDLTFDTDGIVTTAFGFGFSSDGALAIALQPDGKIVAAGVAGVLSRDFALARYHTNGTLDMTFDTDGKVTTDFGSDHDSISAIALQPDGKIVAAGIALIGNAFVFALARYNADGSLDTTFDTDGKVTTDFGAGSEIAFDLALQPDGKIVVAGYGNGDFALARYHTDGSLDTTFDTDGKVTTDFGLGDNSASAVVLQPDGKIVAAGSARFEGIQDFALARYHTNGTLDTTFDTDGKVTTDFGSNHDQASAVALQPDGKVVAAGYAFTTNTADLALARYNTDGSLDTTFDTDGKVTTDFGSSDDSASDIVLQPDGKIIAAGSAAINSRRDFALARYNPDGTLDTTFDTDGKITTNFGLGDDSASAVALQPDGKIVAAGSAVISGTQDFALARYGTCPPAISIKTINKTGNTVTITLDSFTGYTYRLQRSPSLAPAAFINIGSPQSGRTDSVLTFTDPDATGNTAFYRVAAGPW